nr:TIGR03960 family B12-binding radical SAM protein [uncultured Desulfobulbus sp.]
MRDARPLDIGKILPLVRKPGQYVGGELHAVDSMPDDVHLNCCLLFPDLYEIGMSHQGLQILYHILNSDPRFIAHRSYVPDVDMEAEMLNAGLPLFTLEAKVPVAAYDMLGITLPYELCYTNILTALNLAGIPARTEDRDESHPIVLAGGACALNPEPVADFFDAIVLGDGEEIILELAELLLEAKKASTPRQKILEQLAEIPGIYVPSFFAPRYEQDQLQAIEPLKSEYSEVRKRVLPQLSRAPYLHNPLVPVVKTVHDRLGVEIARGCTRGCRFCQAGITYRPVRERTQEEIMELANAGIESSGFEELALLSLSTGDFSCLGPLMGSLMDRFAEEYVSVSMPSMRVGTLTPEIMEEIRRVRKTGFTIAPEAGTDRLREVINKGITEEDLLSTCHDAFSLGWKLIKLYFMIGLPTETDEDIEGIISLARKARAQIKQQGRGKPIQINLGVSTFIPKPHTPFQWEPQIGLEASRERLRQLKGMLPRGGFKLKWHDPEQSFLEGVFSRGDRRLSYLLEAAWKDGARLDSWSEHFDLERWLKAAHTCGLDLETYLRRRKRGEVLPWDHLHSGVDRSFFEQELENALIRQYTPDCRNHGCQGCGLCDFKEIRPVVHKEAEVAPRKKRSSWNRNKEQQHPYKYRVHYSRVGDSRFFGHLELLQLIFRVLQRAGLPVLFSSGFNPSPKVSFSQALPVGVESLDESFDVDLAEPLSSLPEAIERLNNELPSFIRVHAITPAPKKTQAAFVTHYTINLHGGPDPEEIKERIASFMGQEEFIIERFRKNRRQELDLRSLVSTLRLSDEGIELNLLGEQGKPGTNPREILEQVLGLDSRAALQASIVKTEVRESPSLS